MTDFLTRLARRQLGQLPVVEPRLPALYATAVHEAAAGFPIPDTERRPVPRLEETSAMKARATGEHELTDEPGAQSTPPTRPPVEGPEPLVRRDPVKTDAGGPPAPVPRTRADRRTTETQHSSPLRPRAEGELTGRLSAAGPPATAKGWSTRGQAPITASRMAGLVSPGPLADGVALERHDPSERLSAPPSLVAPRQAVRPSRRDSADAVEPPVHVTIGRIEVTALTASPPPKRAPSPRRPAMSLDEYLVRRQRRDR